MKTILVATDGSDHSEHALRLAADLAQKYEAKLLIAHVVDSKPLAAEERKLADVEFGEKLKAMGAGGSGDALAGYGAAGLRSYLRSQDDQNAAVKQVLGEELLKAAQRMLVGMDGFTVETLLLMGDPAQEIVRAAEAKDANLIVIGSRGLSDLKGLWMGSVSHKVSNLSHINVVTCR